MIAFIRRVIGSLRVLGNRRRIGLPNRKTVALTCSAKNAETVYDLLCEAARAADGPRQLLLNILPFNEGEKRVFPLPLHVHARWSDLMVRLLPSDTEEDVREIVAEFSRHASQMRLRNSKPRR